MPASITGAVNGAPAVAEIGTSGASPVTIPYFPGGATSTLDADTDGSAPAAPNNRVAAICGITSGRDHFPFPAKDDPDSVAGAGSYERGVALEVIMQWFWKVKKWRLIGTFDWGVLADYHYTAVFDATLNTGSFYKYAEGPSTLATAESDLVVPGVITNDGFALDITNTADSSHGGFDSGGWALMDNGFGAVPLYYVGGLFYPLFGFEVLTAAGIVAGDDVEIGITDDNTGLTECSGHLEFGGFEYTVYVISQGENVSTDVHVDLAINPIEFWPYATKAGDPVYDTATGAQLRDPLS